MVALHKLLTGTALTLLLATAAGLTLAQDKAPSPEEIAKAMAEASARGPAHAKLDPLAGSWTYTCKTWMGGPTPIESKGTIERKWVLGGRFLEEVYAGTGIDGKADFEGRGLLGYDNSTKKYTSTFACCMTTSVQNAAGDIDSTGTKLTYVSEAFCPLQQCQVKMRDEVRLESKDKVVVDSYMTMGGKEVKMMEIVALRKK